MKKLFLIIYVFLIAFSSFTSFEVYAQGDSCDQKNATTAYNSCIQNNQSNLSDYELCEAVINNGTAPDICIPGDSKFYGRSCDNCCDGTTYDKYNDGDAKECCETNKVIIGTVSADNQECIGCEECRDLYQDVTDALATMSGYANSQTTRPPQSELESLQGTVKTAYDKYKDKRCKEAFPSNDYNTKCPDSTTTNTGTTTPLTASSTDVGIECSTDQLIYGQCKLNVYDTLGIRKADGETSVGIFVQDIVLSATMFIGTIVTVAIVISGLMFVFGGASPSLQDKAKKGLINAIIGLVIVMSSYFIIRLVQFIVKGE